MHQIIQVFCVRVRAPLKCSANLILFFADQKKISNANAKHSRQHKMHMHLKTPSWVHELWVMLLE